MLPGRSLVFRRDVARHRGYLIVSAALLGSAVALLLGAWLAIDGAFLSRYRNLAEQGVHRVLGDHSNGNLSFPDLLDLQHRLPAGAVVGATPFPHVNVDFGGQPRLVRAAMVTHGYFRHLDIPLAAGTGWPERTDERSAIDLGVVVSERFARTHFGAPALAAGSRLTINGSAFTIAGVAALPTHSLDTVPPTDIWLTLADGGRLANPWTLSEASRGMAWIETWVRLPDDVRRADIVEALRNAAAQLERDHPVVRRGARLELADGWQVLWRLDRAAMMGAVTASIVAATLLALAVCNAGILAAVHVLRRATEFQIRLSLGATLTQLRRELAPGWVALGVATAVIGAVGSMVALLWLQRAGLEPLTHPLTHYRPPLAWALPAVFVLAFTAVAPVALVQVLTLTRTDTAELIHTQRGSARRVGLMPLLLIGQGTLSVALAIVAGVHVRSARAALDVEPGFRRDGLVIVTLDLRDLGLEKEEALTFWSGLLDAAAQDPRIAGAGVSNRLPLTAVNTTQPMLDDRRATTPVAFTVVSPGYFGALGVRLLAGRDIQFTDTNPHRPVVLVNESLAAAFWPDADPLGQFFAPFPGTPPAEVVGVVQDVRADFVRARQPALYVPLTTSYTHRSYLYLRWQDRENDPTAETEAFLRRHAPQLPPRAVASFDDYLQQTTVALQAGARGLTTLAYAAIGLILVGTYAVGAYAIAQRRREFAIRMALGAGKPRLLVEECWTHSRAWALSIGLGTVIGVSEGSFGEGSLLLTPAFDVPVVLLAAVALVVVSVASVALALLLHAPADIAEELRG